MQLTPHATRSSGTSAQHGDQRIADLADRYRTSLLRYVSGLTKGDRHLAEDIVQETLLRAWQHPEVRPTVHATIRPWLFTVARNLVRDHHRRVTSRVPEVLDALDALEAAVSPRDEIEDRVAAHDMARALAAVSHEHRTVLVEVYYRDRKLSDTARLLGIPVGTVKSRLYYALRALSRAMTERHGDLRLPQAA